MLRIDHVWFLSDLFSELPIFFIVIIIQDCFCCFIFLLINHSDDLMDNFNHLIRSEVLSDLWFTLLQFVFGIILASIIAVL